MPRRDALSEKKKERLMQEHEQLQKLMLQARSSVRRSSLKEQSGVEEETYFEAEETQDTPLNREEQHEGRAEPAKQETQEFNIEKQEPLTEAELFQNPIASSHEQPAVKRPITERELFPETNQTEPARLEQNNSTIRVILPDQNTPAWIAQPDHRQNELQPVASEPVTESMVAPEDQIEAVEELVPVAVFEPEEKRKGSKTRTYVLLLLAALLAGFGGYYLYQMDRNHKPVVAKDSTKQVAIPRSQTNSIKPAETESAQKTATGKSEAEAPASTMPKKQATGEEPISDDLKNFDNVTVLEKSATPKAQASQPNNKKVPATTANTGLGKYKVISKAYFHNEPDERTRRKAFIIHWNNAVLTPVEEKNGFVYVIFTNHLGQTSKGWLLKKDLKKIE